MAKKRPFDRRKPVRNVSRPRRDDRTRRRSQMDLDAFREREYDETAYDEPDRAASYDEEMLSEFSDDTNEFFTDEHSARQRREPEPRSSKGKKSLKKALKSKKQPDKQRKPISPLRRKIIRILSYVSIVAVILIIGIVLSLTVLFKTQTYEVEGNTRYAEEDIIEACDIGKGQNIFLAPKRPAAKRIKNQFPYMEDVDVSFKIPDTIKISIVEAVEGYLIKASDSEYLVISTKGRILNRTADTSAYQLPIFIGPTLLSGDVGDYVEYEDPTVLEMIESITQTFADNGYVGITEIDATNMANITFTYDGRIKVKLGIPEELDYKVRAAMTIINENLDKNQTGTTEGVLDVSRCHTTKRSYFNEEAIRPTEKKAPTPTQADGDASGTDDGTSEDYSGEDGESYNEDDYADYTGDEGYYGDDGVYYTE